MNRQILSKRAASKWLNVAQSTLSNYLRDGRITPRCLVGEGQRAKIDLSRAVADLKKNLDEERLLLPHRRVYLSTKTPPWWDGLTK
jgi:predicted site-specific integrase-resolvase